MTDGRGQQRRSAGHDHSGAPPFATGGPAGPDAAAQPDAARPARRTGDIADAELGGPWHADHERTVPVGRARARERDTLTTHAARARLRRLVRPPYGASLIAMVLAVLCVGGVAALHVVRPDLDPLRHVLSEYANGPLGPVMTVVFYAAGVACVALGWRLRSALAWHGPAVAVPPLLIAAGAGMIVAGVFEVGLPDEPERVAETVHSLASIGAFLALVGAMVLFAWACGYDHRWRSFRPVATGLATLAVAAAAVSPLADG